MWHAKKIKSLIKVGVVTGFLPLPLCYWKHCISEKAWLIWAGIMSSGDHSATIFITSSKVPSTAVARLIVADSCLLCDAGLCCLLLLFCWFACRSSKKNDLGGDLMPRFVGHCESVVLGTLGEVFVDVMVPQQEVSSILKWRVFGLWWLQPLW